MTRKTTARPAAMRKAKKLTLTKETLRDLTARDTAPEAKGGMGNLLSQLVCTAACQTVPVSICPCTGNSLVLCQT